MSRKQDSLLHFGGRGMGGYLQSLIVILLGSVISSRNTGVEKAWESFRYERGGEGTEWHSSSRTDISLSCGKCKLCRRLDVEIFSDGIKSLKNSLVLKRQYF